MNTQELLEAIQESIAVDGVLPVLIYASIVRKYEVQGANPCSQHDHFLIAMGEQSRD